MADYQTIAQILERTEQTGLSIGETALIDEAAASAITKEEAYRQMSFRLEVMKQSIIDGQAADLRSESGMTNAEGYRVSKAIEEGVIPDDLFTQVISKALAVSCSNACMGRIVAAPTGGASGVLPGSSSPS